MMNSGKLLPIIILALLNYARALEPQNSPFSLSNGIMTLRFSPEKAWQPGIETMTGHPIAERFKTLEVLRPDASEVHAETCKAYLDAPGHNGGKVLLERKGNDYSSTETYTLTADSKILEIGFSLKMKQPLKIGILRLATITGAPGVEAILHSDNRQLAIANTAGLLERLGHGYDFYHGIFDAATNAGLMLIFPENRDKNQGIFRNYRKQPGRLKIGFELKTGDFGELREVLPGDELEFRFQLLAITPDSPPEMQLNALFPGASVAAERAVGIDNHLQVFWDPALYRDDGKLMLMEQTTNSMAVLFYRFQDDDFTADRLQFILDIPENIQLQKSVIFNYWIPRKIDISPSFERIDLDGVPARRYILEAPSPITSVAEKKLYDSYKQHQLYLYFRPEAVAKRTPFKFRWQLRQKNSIPGAVHPGTGDILPKPKAGATPQKIKLWQSHAPLRAMIWADQQMLQDFLHLFKLQGISVLGKPETADYMLPQIPCLTQFLRGQGFKIHHSYGMLRNISLQNLRNPLPGSLWTGLNGKAIEKYTGNNPGLIFCPSFLLRKDTFVYQELQKSFAAMTDCDYIWNDWEGKTFDGCYCSDCRNWFAKHSQIPAELLQSLTPLEMVKKYPLEWIQFRHFQSAEMFRMFHALVRENAPEIRCGMDFEYSSLNQDFPGLGKASTMFCEDPRMMDNAGFDFVLTDSLQSGLQAFDQVQITCSELKMPVVPKTGSVGGLAFYAGSWVSRRLLADFQRRPMGLDFWPRLARVAALGHASSGVNGILLEGAPVDAQTQCEFVQLAEQLALLENYYILGNEIQTGIQEYNCTEKAAERAADNTLAASWVYFGNSFEDMWRFRCHQYEKKILLSFFNFDLSQDRQIAVTLPDALFENKVCIYDPFTRVFIPDQKANKIWKYEELRQSVILSAPPIEAAFLVLCSPGELPPDCQAGEIRKQPKYRKLRQPKPRVQGDLRKILDTYLFRLLE